MLSNFGKAVIATLGAAVVLAGCGGSAGNLSGLNPSDASVTVPNRAVSWMVPQAKQTSLLYVSNAGTQDVTVYTYLDGGGLVLVGTLTGFSFPTGMCSDVAGNVWIPDYDTRKIEEFAHGGTSPVFTIHQQSGHPFDCAIDPSTGNLAVTDQQPGNKHHFDGSVVVYPKGSHAGTSYQPGGGFSAVEFLAYDNKSRLFVDGTANGYGNGLFELAKGGSSLTHVEIAGATLEEPGAVNWIKPTLLVGDGNLGNGGTPGAYKLFISGSNATVVGSLTFAGTQQTYAFWRRAGLVAVPDHLGNVVRMYELSNGNFFSKVGTNVSLPFGAVVSQ